MTIGALFLIAVGAILEFPATVDVAGIELGTIGVILVTLALIGGPRPGPVGPLGHAFFFGSRPRGSSSPDRYP